MSELKPCPFCGKETAEVECDGAFWWVKCQSCGASGHVYWFILNNGNARDIVIDNWNTRPIEDALNARIAELELRLDVYNGNMYDVVVDENAKLEAQVVILKGMNFDFAGSLFKANKRIAELEAERRWIPVSERLPERDGFYLVLENVNQVAGYYHWCKVFGWNTDGGRTNIQSVTHWMPLPEPPEVEK